MESRGAPHTDKGGSGLGLGLGNAFTGKEEPQTPGQPSVMWSPCFSSYPGPRKSEAQVQNATSLGPHLGADVGGGPT